MKKLENAGAPKHRLLMLALVFLANPNINVVDVLPDFIGYLIIIRALAYASDRAPYFAETRADFTKLCFLSLAKIPAFMIQHSVRTGNVGDNDIIALFAFTFGVIELILLVSAIRNLFAGFFYLGERIDGCPLLSAFTYSKKNNKKIKTMTPESLRKLALGFAIFKCAAYALPELLLLSKTVSASQLATYFNVAMLYPYIVVVAVPSVMTVGIIAAKRMRSYISTVSAGGAFRDALDNLIGEEGREELRKKDMVRSMKHALTVFIVAAFFTIEPRFDNFNSVNLFPRFLFAVIMLYGIIRLSKFTSKRKYGLAAAVLHAVSAVVLFYFEINFFDSYGYEMLASSDFARAEFLKLIIVSGIEMLLFSLLLSVTAVTVREFITSHTGISRGSIEHRDFDAEYHKKMKNKTVIWLVIGIISGLTRFAGVVLRYFSTSVTVNIDDGVYVTSSTVTQGLLPWFGAIVFFTAAVFIVYTFHLFTLVREDAELKYQ